MIILNKGMQLKLHQKNQKDHQVLSTTYHTMVQEISINLGRSELCLTQVPDLKIPALTATS